MSYELKNCLCCDKQFKITKRSKIKDYCGQSCRNNHHNFLEKCLGKILTFESYLEASKYFERDFRTLKKFEGKYFKINPETLYEKRRKKIVCPTCKKETYVSLCRNNYCKECSELGIGRKEQGRKISKLYQGKNNPNYIHGNGKQTWRQQSDYKQWSTSVKSRDDICFITGNKRYLTVHHILPASLFPEYRLELWNGITLSLPIHIELHRQQLDIELLPNLYVYRLDAPQLHAEFYRLIQSRLVLPPVEKIYSRHDLVKAAPKNYQRILLNRFPEFAQQALNL